MKSYTLQLKNYIKSAYAIMKLQNRLKINVTEEQINESKLRKSAETMGFKKKYTKSRPM